MQTTTTTRVYAIDPVHSEITFAVRHLMITRIRGSFTNFTGTIVLGPEGDVPLKLEGSVDTASVHTRDEKRDAHVRAADFLDVEQFPKITFTSTSIAGSGPHFTITGDLTIHGVTKSVTLDGDSGGHTKDPWGNDRVGYSATGTINRTEFGVSFNAPLETGGVMLSEEVVLAIDISAVLQK